ncbi:hypothetical protein B0H13DRAFT_2357655 [Mycena leptocephala]|nr:hypothetical protein B0H13DRAFT_2357655 [Mycena leptocephala]
MKPPDTSLPLTAPDTSTSTQSDSSINVPNNTEECQEDANNVTIRTRSKRAIPLLPEHANIVTPPRSPQQPAQPHRGSSPPHRPTPQVRVIRRETSDASAPADNAGLSGEEETPAKTKNQKKKRSNGQDASAKKQAYLDLHGRAETAPSLVELAQVLKDTVTTMRLHVSSAPTIPCFQVLEEIVERVTNHHEFPVEDESRESFSVVVSWAVSSPVKALSSQVEAQHHAIVSLTKTVESLKNAPVLAATPGPSPSLSYAHAAAAANPKPKPPPLPKPSEERILVRFDGPVPPLLSLPYHEILTTVNGVLAPLGLPTLAYTQKQSDTSLFIVPQSKEGVSVLTERWKDWAPSVLPGGHIAPLATHCFLQVDGIPFAGAGSPDELKREFEERNPSLGLVVGTPTWVNKPPSEARAAAGRKPPRAGSLFIRLQSRDMVDKAVAGGRVVLAGTAPAVGRGFPHLRVVPPKDAVILHCAHPSLTAALQRGQSFTGQWPRPTVQCCCKAAHTFIGLTVLYYFVESYSAHSGISHFDHIHLKKDNYFTKRIISVNFNLVAHQTPFSIKYRSALHFYPSPIKYPSSDLRAYFSYPSSRHRTAVYLIPLHASIPLILRINTVAPPHHNLRITHPVDSPHHSRCSSASLPPHHYPSIKTVTLLPSRPHQNPAILDGAPGPPAFHTGVCPRH